MEIKRIIGENIKQIRFAKDLTLNDLSLLSKMSRTYINDIELGKKNISIEKLVTLAKALGVDVNTLITENAYKGFLKKRK